MTLKLCLSQAKLLPFNFESEVERYRQALLDHRMTLERPAPIAPHAIVEHAVKRVRRPNEPDDFVADYEIIDDTPPPPPPPTPAERKQALVVQVHEAEFAAIAKIAPPGKARLWQMEFEAAAMKPEKEWAKEDRATIAAHMARAARVRALQYHGAKLLADIDDLTDVEGWTMAAFPESA